MADIQGGITFTATVNAEQAKSELESTRAKLEALGKTMQDQDEEIEALERKLADLSKAAHEAFNQGNFEPMRTLMWDQQEIKDQINDIKKEKEEVAELSDVLEERAQKLEKAAKAESNATEHTKAFQTKMRELRNEMAQLEIEGNLGGRYREVTAELANMKDAMNDTNQAIKAMASDTKGLDTALSSITFGTAIFEGWTAGMQLLGESTEDAEEAQRQLQTAMSLVQAAQEIQNSLQHQSNLMQAVGRVQDAARIKAENMKAAAIGRTTIAQRIFNKVANANPLGLLVLAVTAVVAAYELLSKTIGKVIARQKEQAKESAELNEKIRENAAEPIAAITELSTKYKNLGDDMAAKKKFVIENKDEFEKLGVAINDVADAERILSSDEMVAKFVSAEMAKARAMAMRESATEKMKKLLEKEHELEGTAKTIQKGTYDRNAPMYGVQATTVANPRYKELTNEVESLREEIKGLYTDVADQEKLASEIMAAINGAKKKVEDDPNSKVKVEVKAETKSLSKSDMAKMRDLEIDLMEEGLEKEIARIRAKYEDLRDNISDMFLENWSVLTEDQKELFTNTLEHLGKEEEKAVDDFVKKWGDGQETVAEDTEDAVGDAVDNIADKLEALKTRVSDSIEVVKGMSDAFYSIGDAEHIKAFKDLSDVLSNVASLASKIQLEVDESSGKLKVQGNSVAEVFMSLVSSSYESAAKIKENIKSVENAALDYANAMEVARLKLEENDGNVFGSAQLSRLSDASTKAKMALEAMQESLNSLNREATKEDFDGVGWFDKWFGYGGEDGVRNEMDEIERVLKEGMSKLASTQIDVSNASGWDKFWGNSNIQYRTLADLAPDLFNEDGTLNTDALEEFLSSDLYNKLDDDTKRALELLKEQQDAYKEALDAIEGYIEDTFGYLGDEALSSLTDAIINGGDAWETWRKKGAAAIESIGEQLMYNLFLQSRFTDFQKQLEELYGTTNLSEEEKATQAVAIMDTFFNGMEGVMDQAQDFGERWKQMARDRGYDIWSNESDVNSASGAVKTITEQSAHIIAGQMNAIRVDIGQQIIVQQAISNTLVSIKGDTRYIRDIYNAISDIRNGGNYLTRISAR